MGFRHGKVRLLLKLLLGLLCGSVFLVCLFFNSPGIMRIFSADTAYYNYPSGFFPPEYEFLLQRNLNLFLLEPSILLNVYVKYELDVPRNQEIQPGNGDNRRNASRMTKTQSNITTWQWIERLFGFTAEKSLTVGVFAEQLTEFKLGPFKKVLTTYGAHGYPDDSGNMSKSITHQFHRYRPLFFGATYHLHIVILYRIENYLWIGPIEALSVHDYRKVSRLPFHYGPSEQIYDPFDVIDYDGLPVPDDIPHFLRQLPTSTYMYCSPRKGARWLDENNMTRNEKVSDSSLAAIRSIKGLMHSMQMEFWIAAGTLLGWYRQCDVIPYTTDSDFATWSSYALRGPPNITQQLRKRAPFHRLTLWKWYGKPESGYESGFRVNSLTNWWHLDLFFTYGNGSHFFYPLHSPSYTNYQALPKFHLCSVALQGYKLLAPCEPQDVIMAEYGDKWNSPDMGWNCVDDSFNLGKWRHATNHSHYLF